MLWAALRLDFKLLVASQSIIDAHQSITIKGTILPRSTNVNSAPSAVSDRLSEAQLRAIDVAVGGQVRTQRIILGMSQEAVSEALGLTFQQLQKYEHGTNRISASRLYQLATILRCPVSYFFDTVDIPSSPGATKGVDEADEVPTDVMWKRQTLELVKAFYAIEDASRRIAMLAMVKSLAKGRKDRR